MIRLPVCDGRMERDDGDVSPGMDLAKANAFEGAERHRLPLVTSSSQAFAIAHEIVVDQCGHADRCRGRSQSRSARASLRRVGVP